MTKQINHVEDFVTFLLQERQRQSLSQDALAFIAKTHVSTIKSVEARRHTTSLVKALKIINALGYKIMISK